MQNNTCTTIYVKTKTKLLFVATHTHIPIYVNAYLSSIGSISYKVIKVFSQMLSTWKMFNKWWLLFPCASKIWELLRTVLCGK